jgi:ribosomal protein S18 acetylase RimI-like enzyme
LVIRRAKLQDLPALVELFKEFIDYNARYQGYFSRTSVTHEHWRQMTADALEKPDCLVLVAEDERGIVGFCTAGVQENPPVYKLPRHGFIRELAVTRSCRREGIGSELFRRAEQWLTGQGISRLELHVAEGNPVSQTFWETLGFRTFIKRMAKDYPKSR